MPGARWFPDLRLNYAETMLALPGRADDDVVVVGRVAEPRPDRPDRRRAARPGGPRPGRAGAPRRRQGRPGGGVPAQHPRDAGPAAGDGQPRRGLLVVRAGVRHPQRGRPLEPDRRRWCWSPSTATATATRRSTAAARSTRSARRCPACATRARCPTSTPTRRPPAGAIAWADLLAEPAELAYERVPFDHPLYILYSSGTTGLPKPIVHGHGGITLEHLKALGLQMDLGPADRFFWFSTTGWMMWDYLVSGLGVGATRRAASTATRPGPTCRRCGGCAAETGITYFGTSAPFLLACRKAGAGAAARWPTCPPLRGVGSTGAPLPAGGLRLGLRRDRARRCCCPASPAAPTCAPASSAAPRCCPVRAGRIAGRCLGCRGRGVRRSGPLRGRRAGRAGDHRADAVDAGRVLGRRRRVALPGGVLRGLPRRVAARRLDHHRRGRVVRAVGAQRRHAQPRRRPARHRGVLLGGRGDAGGRRQPGRAPRGRRGRRRASCCCSSCRPRGWSSTTSCARRSPASCGTNLSPRHVPDAVHAVPALPRTLSGKKLEVPVKRILLGCRRRRGGRQGCAGQPRVAGRLHAVRRPPLTSPRPVTASRCHQPRLTVTSRVRRRGGGA